MRIRRLAAVLVVLFVVAVCFSIHWNRGARRGGHEGAGKSTSGADPKLVDTDVSNWVCWSRDGSALFYIRLFDHRKPPPGLQAIYRYDLRSGKTETLLAPAAAQKLSLSPDDRSVAYIDTSNVYVWDFQTRHSRGIVSSDELVPVVQYAAGDRILFATGTYHVDTFAIGADSTGQKKVITGTAPDILDLDGTGFYYKESRNGEKRWYHFDLLTRRLRQVSPQEVRSRRSEISPDGTHYWRLEERGGRDRYNYVPSKLSIGKVKPSSITGALSEPL